MNEFELYLLRNKVYYLQDKKLVMNPNIDKHTYDLIIQKWKNKK